MDVAAVARYNADEIWIEQGIDTWRSTFQERNVNKHNIMSLIIVIEVGIDISPTCCLALTHTVGVCTRFFYYLLLITYCLLLITYSSIILILAVTKSRSAPRATTTATTTATLSALPAILALALVLAATFGLRPATTTASSADLRISNCK